MKFLMFLVVGITFGATLKVESKLPIENVSKHITVMVIDTGVDSSHELMKGRVIDNTPDDVIDNHGHGTHVAGIILYGNKMKDAGSTLINKDPLCSQVKLIPCKYYDPKRASQDNLKATLKCLKKAIEMKVDYINYSGGGKESSSQEKALYRQFLNQGGTVVVAIGNDQNDLTKEKYYPASYGLDGSWSNFYVVQNIDENGHTVISSNFHPKAIKEVGSHILSSLPASLSRYGYMTGSSQSSPAVLHTILKQKCKQIN